MGHVDRRSDEPRDELEPPIRSVLSGESLAAAQLAQTLCGKEDMGVTNGFLRLPANTLAKLRDDATAFETFCRDYDQPDYLDMDKAGYELLFILDPASIEYDNPDSETPYPAVSAVLSGGETIHEAIDLGYGPAKLVDNEALSDALNEVNDITLETMTSIALESELLPEVLMCDLDADMIKDYHWPYLQALTKFLAEAKNYGMLVLRY